MSEVKFPFLKMRFQVGSAQVGQVNHSPSERVFQRKDVPKRIAQLKKETLQWKEADYVGIRKPRWDASTDKNESDPRNRIHRNRRDFQTGLLRKSYAAENPISAEKAHDLHCHADLLQIKGPPHALTTSSGWNSSTIIQRLPAPVIGANTSPLPAEYLKPTEMIRELNHLLREKKINFACTRKEIKKELRQLYPNASDSRIVAMTFRLLDEKLMAEEKLRRHPVPNESHRPNLSLTAIDRRYKVKSHPGIFTAEGWSCCLNGFEDSAGCESKIANPDRWCLLGFT